MVAMIYCAAGNKNFVEIALRYGLLYGAQMPNKVYARPYFVDQHFKKPPTLERYVAAIAEQRPYMATVKDYNPAHTTLEEQVEWGQAIAPHVTEIILIPKGHGLIQTLPRTIAGKPVRLGYSVPTQYGGEVVGEGDGYQDARSPDVEEFGDWPVHLLGGSAKNQARAIRHFDEKPVAWSPSLFGRLNVASMDNNATNRGATHLNVVSGAGWYQMVDIGVPDKGQAVMHLCFAINLINWQVMVKTKATVLIRPATEGDVKACQKITRAYPEAFGWVTLPSLREGVQSRQLWVACNSEKTVIGFVRYHERKDGTITIHEIAVKKGYQGNDIGKALLLAVPSKPIQLKVVATNHNAIAWYEKQGFYQDVFSTGTKRPLIIMRKPYEQAKWKEPHRMD